MDKYLLNNLEYLTDLMAGQEAHVYKYADREQLFYQCQISISIKEPSEACARPQCVDPQGFGARRVEKDGGQRLIRKRRDVNMDDVVDVRVKLSAFDITDQVANHHDAWVYYHCSGLREAVRGGKGFWYRFQLKQYGRGSEPVIKKISPSTILWLVLGLIYIGTDLRA